MSHEFFMSLAYEQACKAEEKNEVPVGAVIVQGNQVAARAFNQKEKDQQVASHAELLAIQQASLRFQRWDLRGSRIYVTLEPCLMCMGGILSARLDQLIYAAKDLNKHEYETFNFEQQIQIVSGVMEKSCSQILTRFFKQIRYTHKLEEGRVF